MYVSFRNCSDLETNVREILDASFQRHFNLRTDFRNKIGLLSSPHGKPSSGLNNKAYNGFKLVVEKKVHRRDIHI